MTYQALLEAHLGAYKLSVLEIAEPGVYTYRHRRGGHFFKASIFLQTAEVVEPFRRCTAAGSSASRGKSASATASLFPSPQLVTGLCIQSVLPHTSREDRARSSSLLASGVGARWRVRIVGAGGGAGLRRAYEPRRILETHGRNSCDVRGEAFGERVWKGERG